MSASATVDALKAIYTALGGDSADVAGMNYIPDVLNAIAAQVPTATAAELPKVTSSDNGSVLKVANGKWAVGTDATA